jgi:hypothetical protein
VPSRSVHSFKLMLIRAVFYCLKVELSRLVGFSPVAQSLLNDIPGPATVEIKSLLARQAKARRVWFPVFSRLLRRLLLLE